MEEFKSNSHKTKEEIPDRKKVDKVVHGGVKTKKKSSGRKIAEVFLPEDINTVLSNTVFDVIVPALKDTFYDAVTSGLSMLLGGDGRSSSYRRSSSREKESYSSYYNKNSRTSSSRQNVKPKSDRYDYDDVILDSRAEAEEVLDVLTGLVEEYGMASLADLYDAVDLKSNYTDNKYGWCELRTASIVRVREGYMLKLPRTILLD